MKVLLCVVLAVGVALGVSIASVWEDSTGAKIWQILPAVLTSSVTFAVGWWINMTVRHKREIENIPIRYISEVSSRIRDRVRDCVDASSGDSAVEALRDLSNAVVDLEEVSKAFDSTREDAADQITDRFFKLKACLTDDNPSAPLAVRTGQELKLETLKLQMRLCTKILDGRMNKALYS